MAPPKRKAGGRVTPKGTTPSTVTKTPSASGPISSDKAAHHATQASSRYTPPVPREMKESARWVPILMFVLLGLGALTIMMYYLVSAIREPYTLLIGLGLVLGGLFTATKWE